MVKKYKEYSPSNRVSLDRDFTGLPLQTTIKLSRYKFAAKMLSPEDIVLDLGCGNGYSSYFFANFAKKVIGVDLYADIPVISKRLYKDNLKFIRADILKPTQEMIKFKPTVVVAIDVIEHFYKKDGEKIIKIYANLLQSNGMMIIGTPNKFSEDYRSQKSKDIHYHEYEPDEIVSLCKKYFGRTLLFSMNDELVHTGFSKLAWFLFILAFKG